ncbi:hypothetical protein XENTR_v10019253 [Xenopus tropicalis]|nr:hypothetical protein XENTR_v10019253 [Xenopus tropicalis]
MVKIPAFITDLSTRSHNIFGWLSLYLSKFPIYKLWSHCYQLGAISKHVFSLIIISHCVTSSVVTMSGISNHTFMFTSSSASSPPSIYPKPSLLSKYLF